MWGIVAGLCYGAAIVSLYRGLAVGVMSIVAPISATGAVIPVLVSLFLGEVPSVITAFGIAAAFSGAVLVSLQIRETTQVSDRMLRPALVLAFCAALGLGTYIVVLDQATSVVSGSFSPLWVIVGARVGSIATVIAIVALGSWSASWPGRRIGLVAAAGILDTAGNAMLAYATAQGNLGIAAVLSSLYPVVTVLLGLTVLKERLTPIQGTGVTLALLGVILISAG
jgi:drug/metabolite transporter (DMT)-like permease